MRCAILIAFTVFYRSEVSLKWPRFLQDESAYPRVKFLNITSFFFSLSAKAVLKAGVNEGSRSISQRGSLKGIS